MKIAIWAFANRSIGYWDYDVGIKQGLAGSEEAVIFCSQLLAWDGHHVTVFGNPHPSSKYSEEKQNPRYLQHTTFPNRSHFDIVICWSVKSACLNDAIVSGVDLIFKSQNDTENESIFGHTI